MPEGVTLRGEPDHWDGGTYYGRSQLKPSPFSIGLVGGYVFLSGLSGAALLLSTLLDLTCGRAAQQAVRRGRYIALLAPTVGAACLVADLHTPQRFYNMLRVFKRTSPMSLGSWMLIGFGGAAGVTRITQIPGAVLGGGLATYTAALFSATSTPLWAAAPRALAIRFGAASVAGAAAAMALGERRSSIGRDLDSVAVAALAAELAAVLAADKEYRDTGVAAALDGPAGVVERFAGTGLGTLFPLGLHLVSQLFTRRQSRLLSGAASLAILGGSLAMRCSVIAAGDESARRPEISLRFTR
jgi:hypothetical protein